jgi:hypothetical protein
MIKFARKKHLLFLNKNDILDMWVLYDWCKVTLFLRFNNICKGCIVIVNYIYPVFSNRIEKLNIVEAEDGKSMNK